MTGRHRRSGRHRLGTSEPRTPRPRPVRRPASAPRRRGGRRLAFIALTSVVLLTMWTSSLGEPTSPSTPDESAPGSVWRLPRIPELRNPAVVAAASPAGARATGSAPVDMSHPGVVIEIRRAATATTIPMLSADTSAGPSPVVESPPTPQAPTSEHEPLPPTSTVEQPPAPATTSTHTEPANTPILEVTGGRRDHPRWCR